MNSQEQYCIFSTAWGYFGFLADAGRIKQTWLPCEDATLVEQALMRGRSAKHNSELMPHVQQLVQAYFLGEPASFDAVAVSDEGLSPFCREVYATLCKVPLGHTLSYRELACLAGHPGAARAVGRAMAMNPVPLIVPCHRIVRASGKLGGFSALGGIDTKKRLLEHEKVMYAQGAE